MKLFKSALALWLASAMFAQQLPTPAPAPDPVPVRSETFKWQAPSDQPATAQKSQKTMKKGSGKTKWIVIAAVAGAAVVGVAAVNKRLGNEGKGLF
ncbi:MAG: hypothetical protein NTV70_23565 [Acidobacteria bacterium]|nr:hypothetical protein [Acidobacteriota bacterium]